MTFMIIKVSGTDPHKECSVTLSNRTKKNIVVGIMEELLSQCPDEKDPSGALTEIRKGYHELKGLWAEWDEKSVLPTHPSIGTPVANFTEPPQGELVAVDVVTSYDFHWYLQEITWDGTNDLTVVVHDH